MIEKNKNYTQRDTENQKKAGRLCENTENQKAVKLQYVDMSNRRRGRMGSSNGVKHERRK